MRKDFRTGVSKAGQLAPKRVQELWKYLYCSPAMMPPEKLWEEKTCRGSMFDRVNILDREQVVLRDFLVDFPGFE